MVSWAYEEKKCLIANYIAVEVFGLDPYDPNDADACMDILEDLCTTPELGKAVGCGQSTLLRYINKGIIKAYRLDSEGKLTTAIDEGEGRRYFYPSSEVAEVVREAYAKYKVLHPQSRRGVVYGRYG